MNTAKLILGATSPFAMLKKMLLLACVSLPGMAMASESRPVLHVSLERETFVEGQPIAVNVEVANIAATELEFRFPSLSSSFVPWDVGLTDAAGNRVGTLRFEYMVGGSVHHLIVQPGKSAAGYFDLESYVDLPATRRFPRLGPGTYTLRVGLEGEVPNGNSLSLRDSIVFSITAALSEDSVAVSYLGRSQVLALFDPHSARMLLDSLLTECPKSILREGAYRQLASLRSTREIPASKESQRISLLRSFFQEFPDSPFLWTEMQRVKRDLPEADWATLRDAVLSLGPNSRAAKAFIQPNYPISASTRGAVK